MENAYMCSGPGRSVYCIGFYVENIHYTWNYQRSGYYNDVSKVVFDHIPVGAYDLEWSLNDPDEETKYRQKWGSLA